MSASERHPIRVAEVVTDRLHDTHHTATVTHHTRCSVREAQSLDEWIVGCVPGESRELPFRRRGPKGLVLGVKESTRIVTDPTGRRLERPVSLIHVSLEKVEGELASQRRGHEHPILVLARTLSERELDPSRHVEISPPLPQEHRWVAERRIWRNTNQRCPKHGRTPLLSRRPGGPLVPSRTGAEPLDFLRVQPTQVPETTNCDDPSAPNN